MHRWETCYRQGELPWDTGVPEPELVQAVEQQLLPTGRALEIGCGTGTNARFLDRHGWQVLAVDVAPTAIERARAGGATGVDFAVHDVLAKPLPRAPFDLVFDRGCFHSFDADEHRATFAERVAAALRPGGLWFSLVGSTEGPWRDHGPPRRSARDIVLAVEPALELIELRATSFALSDSQPMAWACLARKRQVEAQPSTRR